MDLLMPLLFPAVALGGFAVMAALFYSSDWVRRHRTLTWLSGVAVMAIAGVCCFVWMRNQPPTPGSEVDVIIFLVCAGLLALAFMGWTVGAFYVDFVDWLDQRRKQ